MPDYYVDIPVETDAETLQDDAVEYLQDKVVGYALNPAHPLTWLIEATGRMAEVQALIAAQVPSTNLRYLGRTIFSIPSEDGAPAIAATTWTAVDDAGYLIPEGTQITIDDVPFVTDADVTIAAMATSTMPGEVLVTAVLDGTDGNGLGSDTEPVDALAWVDEIVTVGSTSGGADAETDPEYQDRLVRLLQTRGLILVTPLNFETFTLEFDGVERAAVIDLYNPYTNLLTANQASLETNTVGWAAVTNNTISQSATFASDGANSLRLSSTAGGDMSAATTKVAINGGQVYTARAEFRAGASARTVRIDLRWYDANSVLLSTATGTGVADATGSFTIVSTTATAPATATQVDVKVNVLATGGAAELHYVDKIALKLVASSLLADASWSAGGTDPTVTERTVTVVPIDENGDPVSAVLKALIVAGLLARREVNFVVNAIDPQYGPVAIRYAVVSYPGFDTDDLKTQIDAALTDYTNKAAWGQPPFGESKRWVNTPVVRYQDISAVINNVEGVEHWTTLLINNGTVDVTLPGIAPLPTVLATQVLTATTSNGSASVTALSGTGTLNLTVGMSVAGVGIVAGTTIQAITSGTAITLSQNAGVGSGAGTSLTFTSIDGTVV